MSNEYRDAQIVKHALQYYINRPNASELDLKREQKVLDKVTNQVKDMQENWDIKNKEERKWLKSIKMRMTNWNVT